MTLLWPLALLLPLSLIGVWLLVRRTLRSVLAFRAEIGTPGQGYLTPVAAPDLPAEIALLAVEVNNLIDRLRRALAAERSFTASAAHELRTPVAAALAQTQRLIAELDQGPLQDRAKAEGAGLLAETGQDLVPVLRLVLQDLPGAAAVDLIVPSGPVESLIDLDAFAILARNLMKMPCATAIPTQRSGIVRLGVQPPGPDLQRNLGHAPVDGRFAARAIVPATVYFRPIVDIKRGRFSWLERRSRPNAPQAGRSALPPPLRASFCRGRPVPSRRPKPCQRLPPRRLLRKGRER